MQGLLELAGVPYVGAGVAASAAGMDKAIMKALFAAGRAAAGASTACCARRDRRRRGARPSTSSGLPLFVKPANLGSSVGGEQGEDARRTLAAALEPRLRLRPQGGGRARRRRARDRGLGPRQRRRPRPRCPARSCPTASSTTTTRSTPPKPHRAPHPGAARRAAHATRCRRSRVAAFRAVDAAGYARVDCFLERGTRPAAAERDQHHPRLHLDQHVPEAVGGERARLRRAARAARGARRSSASARARACTTHYGALSRPARRSADGSRAPPRPRQSSIPNSI